MASNVFPMLSSSPPPIDDCPDDDDDDDEFGNFTSANIPFDSSFDSPVAVEKFKPFKAGDNGVNDVNVSNEIHKFNSFSNSASPSPQEFVPNFTIEEDHYQSGFTPIKTENCKIIENNFDTSSIEDSICHNDIQVTSHKPVPIKSGLNIPSSNKSGHKVSDGCHTQDSTFSNPCESNVEENTVKSEYASLEKLPVCDSPESKVAESALNFCKDERTDKTCNEVNGFISESIPSSEFENNGTKIESVTVAEEICLSCDKFECDFNSEENEIDCEEFSNFQTSENLVTSNHVDSSCIKSLEDKCSISSDKDTIEINKDSKSDFTNNPVLANSQDFSDNEFDDFQGFAEKNNFAESSAKSNEDFDDFQDFQHSKSSNEEEDGFANFQDFSAGDASNPDDFADFSAAPFDSNKMANSTESCEFADFEEASFSAPAESSFQLSSSSSCQKSVDPLSTVINTIFPLSDHEEIDTSEETSLQILEQTNKSRRLWEKLHEVEQTPGLRFQWGVSHSFQQLLRSVNVDYHSILRTSSVPIFASGLSLLEPVKGLSNSANHESDDRHLFPKDPIPPVEFDWNSSGLINPLDSGQAASTLMDLSFLSSVETNSNATSSDFSLENELLKPSPPLPCPESNSRTQILEQLLSKNVSSLPNSKITHRPSDLTDEAVRVLDQFPDLSFMQAKVLMFPLSSKT